MSQQAQAQTFQDDGHRGFAQARRRFEELKAKNAKGELSGEELQTQLKAVHAEMDDAEALTKIADRLATFRPAPLPQANLAADDEPVYRRPMGDNQHSLPHNAVGAHVSNNVSTLGALNAREIGMPVQPGALSHLSSAEIGQLARISGLHPWQIANCTLQGKNRELANAFLRGGECRDPRGNLSEQGRQQLLRASELAGGGATNFSPYIDQSGGWLVTEEIRPEVLMYMRDARYVRSLANVIATNAGKYTIRSMKLRIRMKANIPGRTLTEESSIRDFLGRTSWTPFDKSGIVTLPIQHITDPMLDVVSEVSRAIAEEAYDEEEEQFLIGDGSQKPYGILTALRQTTQITNVASQGTILRDNIRTLPDKLKTKFHGGSVYMTGTQANEMIRLFREETNGTPGSGGYLYDLPMIAGDRRTLNGSPYIVNDFFPDYVTSGVVGDPLIIFGNWNLGYQVVDGRGMQIRVLNELYINQGEIGYHYTKATDGGPLRLEAFVGLGRGA